MQLGDRRGRKALRIRGGADSCKLVPSAPAWTSCDATWQLKSTLTALTSRALSHRSSSGIFRRKTRECTECDGPAIPVRWSKCKTAFLSRQRGSVRRFAMVCDGFGDQCKQVFGNPEGMRYMEAAPISISPPNLIFSPKSRLSKNIMSARSGCYANGQKPFQTRQRGLMFENVKKCYVFQCQ